jgi:ankyrin repeat protein
VASVQDFPTKSPRNSVNSVRGRPPYTIIAGEFIMKCLSDFREKNGRIITRDSLNVCIFGGFDINEQDLQGNTYLHLSVSAGDFDAVKLFCDSGAKLDIRNKNGKKPIDLAAEKVNDFPSENSVKILDAISASVLQVIQERCDKAFGFKKGF